MLFRSRPSDHLGQLVGVGLGQVDGLGQKLGDLQVVLHHRARLGPRVGGVARHADQDLGADLQEDLLGALAVRVVRRPQVVDRKSVGEGKSGQVRLYLVWRRTIKKKKKN